MNIKELWERAIAADLTSIFEAFTSLFEGLALGSIAGVIIVAVFFGIPIWRMNKRR